jgi:hypothetical protein
VTARPQRARQAGRGHGDAAQLLLDTRRPGAALSSTSAHPAAWRSPPFSPSAMAPCRLSRDPRPGGGGGVTPAAGWERRVRGRGPRRPDEFTFVSPCGELSLRGRCVSSFLPLFCKTNDRARRKVLFLVGWTPICSPARSYKDGHRSTPLLVGGHTSRTRRASRPYLEAESRIGAFSKSEAPSRLRRKLIGRASRRNSSQGLLV